MALCMMKTNAIKVKFCYLFLLIVLFFQAMLKWKYHEQQYTLKLAQKNLRCLLLSGPIKVLDKKFGSSVETYLV